MKTISYKMGFIVSVLLICTNCKKPVSYPDEPEIHFKSFLVSEITDSMGKKIIGELAFSFIDGMGDIGYRDLDSNVNTDSLSDSAKYNLFFTQYNKINGVFEKDSQNVKQYYTIPYIENVKGDIIVTFDYLKINYDTIKYTFYIIDRKMKGSNVEETPELILKKGFFVQALK